MKHICKFAAAAAALATPASGLAQAKDAAACLSKPEVTALVAYALPEVIVAARDKCTATLGQGGYLARSGDELTARYKAEATGNWPVARTAMLKIMADKDKDDMKLFSSMPDQAVSALFTTFLGQAVAADIKPKDCAAIDTIAEELAPLPAANTARLIAFILQSEPKAGKGAFPVCKA